MALGKSKKRTGSAAPSGRRLGGGKAAPKAESGVSKGALGVAGVGLGVLGAVGLKNPALAKTMLSKVGAARQQAMLSGLALPKSLLGNLGAGIEASIERRSMKPLKELFSKQTLKDATSAYKTNQGAVGAGTNAPRQATLPGPMPGRFMGAMDEATQKAMVRGGLTPLEAQSSTLQAPLEGRLARALDSPASRYLIPFRRTPFNQFFEGLERLPGGASGSKLGKAVYTSAGAAHGAATSEDKMPLSIPLATALASRYGLPYGAAALIGRHLAGGKSNTSGIAGSMLPVSEYGISSSLVDPTRAFTQPAAFTALDKILGNK